MCIFMLTFCFFHWHPGVSFPFLQECQGSCINLYEIAEGLRSLLIQWWINLHIWPWGRVWRASDHSKLNSSFQKFLASESWHICMDNQPSKFLFRMLNAAGFHFCLCWTSTSSKRPYACYLLMVTLKGDEQVNMGYFLISAYIMEGITPGHWAVRVFIGRLLMPKMINEL